MKQLKRSLALMLAVAVLAGLFVTSASAKGIDPVVAGDMHIEDYIDVTEKNNAEAIYALTALGIFEGYTGADAGKFKPEATITRAEFAKIVYFLSGNTEEELAYYEAKASAFGDVAEGHWAEGYINACAEQGLYVGYPDGTFRPTVNLTKQQVVTVVLRMVGYDDNLPGVWPANYITKAKNVGLIVLNGITGTQDADRDTVAQICYDALGMYMVTYINNETTQGLGYVMGQVDADGYAYIQMMTNEGSYEEMTLINYALGAEFWSVDYAEHEDVEYEKFEAAAWGFEDFAKGELEIAVEEEYEQEVVIIDFALASKYYIYGGQLVDLGDNDDGYVIYDWENEEVVFAHAGKKPANFFKTTGNGHNYYGEFEDAPFAIVEDKDDNYTYLYDEDYIAENAKLSAYRAHVYFNMTTREFIDASDLSKGDVIYCAGLLTDGRTVLFLVYNPVDGKFEEYDDEPDMFVEISKKQYAIAEDYSFVSFSEGDEYVNFVDALNDDGIYEALTTNVKEFGDVEYVVAYNGSELAYMRKDLRDTYVYGVVVDYKLTSQGLYWDPSANGGEGGYNELWMITAIDLFLADGTTKTFNLHKDYWIAEDLARFEESGYYYGDLITLMETSKGYEIYTEYENDDVIYGWTYGFEGIGTTEDNLDTIKKSGSTRVAIEWDGDQQYPMGDSYEVYTTNKDTFAFYVTVNGTKVNAKILDQEALLAAGGNYRQILPFGFYNKDNTGIEVLYMTDKEGAANPNTYYVGLATQVTKRAEDKWAITIDGTRYTTANGCTFGTEEDLDEIDFSVLGKNQPAFVLYQLDNSGKIYNIEFVADMEYVAGQYEDEPAEFELSTNKVTYKLIVTDIYDVTFTRGDKRIEIDENHVDFYTLFTEDATVIDLTNKGKALDAAADLENLVYEDECTFVIIYDEATNDVLYILAVNADVEYVS